MMLFAAGVVRAANAAPFDPDPVARKAAQLFNPGFVRDPEGVLRVACADLMLVFQAVSIIGIIAALIWRMQKTDRQLEGVAATLLKVGFIATVPLWLELLTTSSDAVVDAVTGRDLARGGAFTMITPSLWRLLGEWVPPGSPYLDALAAQAAEAPSSGAETEWALQAWNWARGAGTADASAFQGFWQAQSGSLRALVVFAGCSVAVVVMSITLAAVYMAELFRHLLLFGGAAVVPLFIAGLALDGWRGFSLKSICVVGSVAVWPLGWTLASLVTVELTDRVLAWMRGVSAAAMQTSLSAAPSLAGSAPFVAWGYLFVFLGLTVALAVWTAVVVAGVPLLLVRSVSGALAIVDRGSCATAAPTQLAARETRGSPDAAATSRAVGGATDHLRRSLGSRHRAPSSARSVGGHEPVPILGHRFPTYDLRRGRH